MSPMRKRMQVDAPGADEGVTMLELFFDLVFVFTITQLTGLVRESTGASGYLHAAAILVLTWWMYDGYAWLSNNVGPRTPSTSLPMLVGMTGFLVMAIATPDAFDTARWPFAIAYLVVVVVHGFQFARSSQGESANAIWQVLPLNMTVVALLVTAAAIGRHWGWICWTAAVAVLVYSVASRRESRFSLRPDHFAERHQLVIIIALGETVVATGAGAEGRIGEWRIVSAVVLSMALVSALWWVYFGGDSDRGAAALGRLPEQQRMREAIWAYAIGHLVHVAGLVLVAAGLHDVVESPSAQLPVRVALTMAAGCATFLLGEVVFLQRLHLHGRVELIIGAAAALAVGMVGRANGAAELGALVVILVCTVTVRGVRRGRPEPSSAGSAS